MLIPILLNANPPPFLFCFSNMFSNHQYTNIRQFVPTKTEQSKMIHPTRSLQLNDRFDFITIQIQVYHSLVHRIRCKWPQILYLQFRQFLFYFSSPISFQINEKEKRKRQNLEKISIYSYKYIYIYCNLVSRQMKSGSICGQKAWHLG